ncbi:sigma-70 family RNA polymerase sigma factor [Frankia sp. CNm7]|uniref:Sigma-70 family RNA polymerase sigma factor n=1 Tax=Frankia nepalensis TaxID=1836974 RepID=A0A937UV11_9ACTN|nr:sigma-70 family RNA polymerase sigma factor [Frankia nepalensis]MBL7499969.1 sigma-70 family RNA polymerase sigma factor [Frankia nepalensis]MBL7512502.1 sigma-70 family RNA polymerase sigma factor [Frankia nepalensis]MBL7517445.1 sigma-70 family RNA polymerase sigma factor [Frankia nepalensis]MBL7632805.1 sigma-70 family RNA polymerase sigma factor [Frankia nepalensis]
MPRHADDDDGRALYAVAKPDYGPSTTGGGPADAEQLLLRAGRGDGDAFAAFYDQLAPRVFGLVKRVLRDPAQAEEVTQEVFVEIWRLASRFDPVKGSAVGWVCALAHRRAVDRVRSAQAATERERRVGMAWAPRDGDAGYDEVTEQVELRLEYERLRRCLGGLTDLQRESIVLAYYNGHTYREVAHLLSTPVPTVKTRMRDGLIRLRDCLGVGA